MFSKVAVVALALAVPVSAKTCDKQNMCVDAGVAPGNGPITVLVDGLPAWGDLPGAHFLAVPPQVENALVEVPLQRVEGGTHVVFTCPSYGPTCDALVLIFECRPCVAETGGLIEYLAEDGWQRTRCAPQFTTGVAGTGRHVMVSYRVPVLPGTQKAFTTSGDIEWVVFAIQRQAHAECSTYDDAPSCNAQDGFCRWAGTCELNTCVAPGPSYRVGCTTCPAVPPPVYVAPTAEPTTVEPTSVEPTSVEPTTLQPPVYVRPTPQPPVYIPPTAEPTTVEPTTVEPTTVEPTTVEPTTVEPTTVEPTTVEPTTVEPTTVQPPVYVRPTPQPPVYIPPTAEPTTVEPTTVEPTTVEPTTVEPTTVEPTTVEPTTVEPTTVEPTTVEPTTVEPTTVEPTTVEPTTVQPPVYIRPTPQPPVYVPPTKEPVAYVPKPPAYN